MGQLFDHIIDTWDRILTEGPNDEDLENGVRIACTTALGALSVVGVGALLPIATVGGTVLGATISGCFSAAAEIGEIQGQKDKKAAELAMMEENKALRDNERDLKTYKELVQNYEKSVVIIKAVFDSFCNDHGINKIISDEFFKRTIFSFKSIEPYLTREHLTSISIANKPVIYGNRDFLNTPLRELDGVLLKRIAGDLVVHLMFTTRDYEEFELVIRSLNKFAKLNKLY